MYLELSRPAGDTSRWEKVFKRLTLLNKYYPIQRPGSCETVDFQRNVDTLSTNDSESLYFIVRDSFIEQEVVFFGGYASSLYTKSMPQNQRRLIEKIPDFDVLSTDPKKCALILLETIKDAGFKKCKMIEHAEIGEIVPKHIEIVVGKETLAFIYEPNACHNYNAVQIAGKEIRVATIDTMLSFYLAFIYTNQTYFPKDRILCMANFLFEVEQKNRLHQKGVLKRFSANCYGEQPTLATIRAEKSEKFKEFKEKGVKRGSPEWNEWFFKYSPEEDGNSSKQNKNRTQKIKRHRRRRRTFRSLFF
jgi:uncharacterized ParB-like nuclease family protein